MLAEKEDLEIREILRSADLAEKTGPESALAHLTNQKLELKKLQAETQT